MEKRESKRFCSQASMTCGIFNNCKTYHAEMINYSKNGMCFKCDSAFNKGVSLLVRINGRLPDYKAPEDEEGFRTISVGQVKWWQKAQEEAGSFFTIGIRFY
jgi:hypothetical protein